MRLLTLARKALRLLASPQFAGPALRHRVAAAVEHLEAIRHTAAATLIDIGTNKGQPLFDQAMTERFGPTQADFLFKRRRPR